MSNPTWARKTSDDNRMGASRRVLLQVLVARERSRRREGDGAPSVFGVLSNGDEENCRCNWLRAHGLWPERR